MSKFPVDTNAAGLSHTWRIAGVREELERGRAEGVVKSGVKARTSLCALSHTPLRVSPAWLSVCHQDWGGLFTLLRVNGSSQ